MQESELSDGEVENPERVSRVSLNHGQYVFLNQIVNHVILYLHKIHLNETKANHNQNK
jgi:hypothetical protein